MIFDSKYGNQNNINKRMTIILIDWLNLICVKFQITNYQYIRIIYYVNQFIKKNANIDKNELQGIGVCCLMYIFKEFTLKNCVYLCYNKYDFKTLDTIRCKVYNCLYKIPKPKFHTKICQILTPFIYFVSLWDILFEKVVDDPPLLQNIIDNKNVNIELVNDLKNMYKLIKNIKSIDIKRYDSVIKIINGVNNFENIFYYNECKSTDIKTIYL